MRQGREEGGRARPHSGATPCRSSPVAAAVRVAARASCSSQHHYCRLLMTITHWGTASSLRQHPRPCPLAAGIACGALGPGCLGATLGDVIGSNGVGQWVNWQSQVLRWCGGMRREVTEGMGSEVAGELVVSVDRKSPYGEWPD